MIAKKEKKALKRGDIDILTSDIFVVNAQKYRPFIESFTETPTNFTKQNLGTLLGFFYISDFSQDSANIVNYLTSTIKKEYFINPRRNITDSFESALHHVNCALAEIAKEGNVGWLGNIDAAVCVIDQQMIHFSVAGEARILLIRDGVLTDISEGLASEEATEHPLKTFADIASGKLKENDKVIIATPELFSLFSMEEIERNAARHSSEAFLQFLNTALVNECNVAGTFVFDVIKREHKPAPALQKKKKPKDEKPLEIGNVFGSSDFQQQQGITNGHKDIPVSKGVSGVKKGEKKDEKEDDYVDKTTGHIYIQGEDDGTESSALTPLMSHIQDFYEDTKHVTKKTSRSAYASTKTTLKNTCHSASKKSSLLVKKNIALLAQKFNKPKSETPTEEHLSGASPTSQTEDLYNDAPSITFMARIKGVLFHIAFLIKKMFGQITYVVRNLFTKNSSSSTVTAQQTSSSHRPRISRIYSNMSTKKKYTALVIVLVIVLTPLLIHKISGFLQKEEVAVTEDVQEESIADIGQDFFESTIDDGQTLFTKDGMRTIHSLNDVILATTTNTVTLHENGESSDFPLPDGAGAILRTAMMTDLNLLFIHTDNNSLYAFSPVDKKFTKNTIVFPDNVSDIETYLTYLYVTDAVEGQIYRYPRATDGFSDKKNWLSDDTEVNFEKFVDMTVNENVYIASDTELNSFARGVQEETLFDTSGVTISQIMSAQDTEFIYILDTENAKLLQFSKDGEMKKDWIHPDFADAGSFSVNTENTKAVFTINNEAKEFSF